MISTSETVAVYDFRTNHLTHTNTHTYTHTHTYIYIYVYIYIYIYIYVKYGEINIRTLYIANF